MFLIVQGHVGPRVVMVQGILRRLGADLTIDGDFGPVTAEAVRAFQRRSAHHALPVAIACALVGVIIGIINLTGVAAEMGGYVIALGRDNLLLALVLTMLTCLVLGMGIPTIPNYIITSSLAAPILLELGVPLIVSHMFVFYFGIMADLILLTRSKKASGISLILKWYYLPCSAPSWDRVWYGIPVSSMPNLF